MIPRLQEKYEQEILPALAERLGRKNRLCLPRLQCIVINMGVGKAIQDKKHLEAAVEALTQITGPETDHHACPQVDRQLSPPRGHGHRLQSHFAAAADVRVPGPVDRAGPPPRP